MAEEKLFCDACGAPLVPGEKECVACGQPIDNVEAPADAPVISAEEWSKPAEVVIDAEPEHDRYGTPTDDGDADSPHRWGTPTDAPEPAFMREPAPVTQSPFDGPADPQPVVVPPAFPTTVAQPAKSNKIWIIIAVVLLLCLCLGVFGVGGLITRFVTGGV